jgi:hypothetical protein
MSTRVEVLLWAGRVIARKGGAPHELLEIPADATLDQAQDAFHKLARIAHPDLHRTTLDAAELEKVTTAYAYAAAAYQQMRVAKNRVRVGADKPTPATGTPAGQGPGERPSSNDLSRAKPTTKPAPTIVLPGGGIVRGSATRPPPTKAATQPPATTPTKPATPPSATPAAPAPEAPDGAGGAPGNASTAMNSKALVYYRKAEMALRQGDLRMAVLNLKMGIAADPASQFLRQAFAEVDAELKAK